MRERIGLAQIQAARLVGDVEIIDCVELSPSDFKAAEVRHGIPPNAQSDIVNRYKRIYAWDLARPRRYVNPAPHQSATEVGTFVSCRN